MGVFNQNPINAGFRDSCSLMQRSFRSISILSIFQFKIDLKFVNNLTQACMTCLVFTLDLLDAYPVKRNWTDQVRNNAYYNVAHRLVKCIKANCIAEELNLPANHDMVNIMMVEMAWKQISIALPNNPWHSGWSQLWLNWKNYS